MHITGDMFDGRCNGVPGGEQGVHDNAKVFILEVSLVQDFKKTSIIEVMVKRHSEMGVCDDGD